MFDLIINLGVILDYYCIEFFLGVKEIKYVIIIFRIWLFRINFIRYIYM